MAKNSSQQQHPQADSNHLVAYVVDKYTGRDGKEYANWMRIGVAFAHKDGKGFNLQLKAVPVNGELVVRVPEPKDEEDDQG